MMEREVVRTGVRAYWLVGWVLLAGVINAQVMAGTVSRLPQFQDVRLSPNGEHLLLIIAAGDHYELAVESVATGERTIIYSPDAKRGAINWCGWANDNRILCSFRQTRGAGRVGHVIFTRLAAMDRDGSNVRTLIPRAKNHPRKDPIYNAQVQDRLLSWLPDNDEEVLLQLNRENPNRPSVYRLNIYNNKLHRVTRPRSQVRRWFANRDGEVALGIGFIADEHPVVYALQGPRLVQYQDPVFSSEIPPSPLGFSKDNQYVYMNMTNGRDRHGVFKVRLDDGAVIEPVFQDPEFDVFATLVQDPETGDPAGVRYMRHHPTMVWFDERLERLFTAISDRVPGDEMEMIASDSGYRRFVVYGYGGISPGYYLVDAESSSVRLLGKDYPDLADEDVVDLQPVEYRSSDGVAIPAYLALPNDVDGPVPTVLLPHGGPYARDSAQFDAWAQHLVQMGVAVLKPNYRGSVGYGELFMRAGYREWGQRMQDDLMDGLDWLVEQGIADPDRVCIVGASYGGYTALVSAYKYADRIKCAVSMAGITDLEKMVRRIYSFELTQRNRSRIQSNAELRENSPYHQVERIDVPLLLVHGEQDTVVRVRQSRALASALKQHGKPHEYIEQPNGDHYLSVGSHRSEFFDAMQRFIGTHLQL